MHLEAQPRHLVDVARGPHGARVDVVDGVVVERVLLVAGEDVGEARRVGEAEDAVSGSVSNSLGFWDEGLVVRRRKMKEGGGWTHDGSKRGAQTMAMLSGIMTWYPACVCRSRELMKQLCVGCV